MLTSEEIDLSPVSARRAVGQMSGLRRADIRRRLTLRHPLIVFSMSAALIVGAAVPLIAQLTGVA